MDKYRKIYNDNYLGTTVISIFKSHFACFKMQQQKGKTADIDQFLDNSVQNAIKMRRKLKLSGTFPFVNQVLGTGKEEGLLIEVIENKRKEVLNLFLQDDISDEEIIRLVYTITDQTKVESARNIEDKLKLVKDFILKCNSKKRKMHLGDRTFGYLIKAELIPANIPQERLDAWNEQISDEKKPSNTKFFCTPELSRNNSNLPDLTLIKHLEKIQKFFNEVGLKDVADIVIKDIEEELTKPK